MFLPAALLIGFVHDGEHFAFTSGGHRLPGRKF